MEAGQFGLPRKLNLWNTDQVFLTRATPGTSTGGGVLNIGNGLFDGVSTGTHGGSTGGTILAINTDVSFSGGFFDMALAGSTKYRFYPVRLLISIVPTTGVTNLPLLHLGNQSQFSGSINGTAIGIDLSSGYAGNLLDYQKSGVSQFLVANNGLIIDSCGQGAAARLEAYRLYS